MNKLSQCELYNAYKNLRPDVVKMLTPAVFEKYDIPYTFFESYVNILSNKKYPLLRPVIKATKAGKIHLFNFADPIDPNGKKFIVHPSFSVGLGANSKKEIVSYVNAAEKSGYIRNNAKEAIGLKIDENHLYGYLLSGYAGILTYIKDREITENVKLQADMAEVYSILLSAVINKVYPISMESDSYVRMNFLCALFYLQYMAGYDEDSALKLALKVKTVDPVVVGNSSKALQLGVIKMKTFDDFLNAVKVEFSFINIKEISLRALSEIFKTKYGPSSLFAIEHFQTLLNLTLHVSTRTNLYNDYALAKMLPKPLLDDIQKNLLLISES